MHYYILYRCSLLYVIIIIIIIISIIIKKFISNQNIVIIIIIIIGINLMISADIQYTLNKQIIKKIKKFLSLNDIAFCVHK